MNTLEYLSTDREFNRLMTDPVEKIEYRYCIELRWSELDHQSTLEDTGIALVRGDRYIVFSFIGQHLRYFACSKDDVNSAWDYEVGQFDEPGTAVAFAYCYLVELQDLLQIESKRTIHRAKLANSTKDQVRRQSVDERDLSGTETFNNRSVPISRTSELA